MFSSARLLACLTVLLLPLAASAEERRTQVFPLANRGSLHLQVPKSWQGMVVQPAADQPPTVEFTTPGSSAFRVLVTAFLPAGQAGAPVGLGQVRKAVEIMAEKAQAQSTEPQLTLMDLKGPAAAGYYFSATDRAPRPGDYKYLTQGALRLGDLFVTFTALANDGAEGVAGEVLSAVAGANYDAPGSAPGPVGESETETALKITERTSDYLVTQPGSALRLRIPKGGLRIKKSEEGQAERRQYFLFQDERASLVLSGWFEQKRQYPGLVALWLEETRSWRAAGLPEPRALSFGWLGGWEAVYYDIVLPGATDSHLRAHWVQSGTWIDAHLSITARESSEALRARLRTLLMSLEVLAQH